MIKRHSTQWVPCNNDYDLAKLGDGLDESPTVMVGDKKNKKNSQIKNQQSVEGKGRQATW